MLELDFGTEYKVICKSDYCTFVVASGSKAECEKYISEYSNENIFPLILNTPYNNKEEK